MPNIQGGPVEVAGAAYQQERAAADDASMLRLRARRWLLSRRDDDVSRARLSAVRHELAWRAHR
jgi:hypothetical protein